MDNVTFQTIIEGGILFTLIFLGTMLIGKLQGIINSINEFNDTVKGGTKPPPPPPPSTTR
ncbi:MAG: hypothetical protein ABJA35_09150 [Parafilimonas sp.]